MYLSYVSKCICLEYQNVFASNCNTIPMFRPCGCVRHSIETSSSIYDQIRFIHAFIKLIV